LIIALCSVMGVGLHDVSWLAIRLPYTASRTKLGEGILGLVYRAYDPVLHRQIALKIVRPEVGTHALGELSGRPPTA